MEDFWSRYARGAVPQNLGMTSYSNPSSTSGMTQGWDWRTAINQPYATRQQVQQANPRDAFLKSIKGLLDQANKKNDERYNQGLRLLGLDPNEDWRAMGFSTEDAYLRHKEAQKSQPAPLQAPAVNVSPWGTGSAPIMSPQAAETQAQMKSRGIYNTSTALNKMGVTNSLALADAEYRARNQGLQESQMRMNEEYRSREEADRLLGRRLDWIFNRNDVAPNLDRVMSALATEGAGNTEGLTYPASAPRSAPASSLGYFMPQIGQYSPPVMRRKRTIDPVRMQSYATTRAARQAGIRPQALTYGVETAPNNGLRMAQGLV
jgi:hypothetical protein